MQLRVLIEKTNLALAGFVFFIGILAWLCMDPGHSWDDDFALYLEQTNAILSGNLWQLYDLNRYAMDWSGDTTGPYLYPMGFPILLLPVVAISGLNWLVIKVYCFLFFLGGICLLPSIMRTFELQPKTIYPVIFLVGINYHFVRFGDLIYADLPFFFFILLAIYWAICRPSSLLKQVIVGLLIFFAYWIKPLGIVLFMLLLVEQYRTKRLLHARSYLPYFIFVGCWLLSRWLLPAGDSNHWAWLQQISWQSIGNNAGWYYQLLGNYWCIFKPLPEWLQYGIATFFVAIIGLGIAKAPEKMASLLPFCIAYLAVCLCWISFQGMRLIFPILPFVVVYVVLGIQYLFEQRSNLILAGLSLFCLAQTTITCYYYSTKDTNEVATAEMQTVYTFIQQELPPDAIIQFQKPRTLRLFTGRNSCQKNTAELTHILRHKNAIKTPTDKILLQTPAYELIQL